MQQIRIGTKLANRLRYDQYGCFAVIIEITKTDCAYLMHCKCGTCGNLLKQTELDKLNQAIREGIIIYLENGFSELCKEYKKI